MDDYENGRIDEYEATTDQINRIADDLCRKDERMEALEKALSDALAGLRYVREMYPNVLGVGFDRCEAYRALISQPDATP